MKLVGYFLDTIKATGRFKDVLFLGGLFCFSAFATRVPLAMGARLLSAGKRLLSSVPGRRPRGHDVLFLGDDLLARSLGPRMIVLTKLVEQLSHGYGPAIVWFVFPLDCTSMMTTPTDFPLVSNNYLYRWQKSLTPGSTRGKNL